MSRPLNPWSKRLAIVPMVAAAEDSNDVAAADDAGSLDSNGLIAIVRGLRGEREGSFYHIQNSFRTFDANVGDVSDPFSA